MREEQGHSEVTSRWRKQRRLHSLTHSVSVTELQKSAIASVQGQAGLGRKADSEGEVVCVWSQRCPGQVVCTVRGSASSLNSGDSNSHRRRHGFDHNLHQVHG